MKHKLTNRWGIQLLGHEFDLADWLEALKPPFDPYVEFHAEQHVLRWSGFEACQTAVEVRDEAIPLVERLNGVIAITKDTRRIEFNGGVIEFGPDGTLHRTFGPDGQEITQPPQSSPAQHWVGISEDDELLADALIYFARGEWFDVFKAIECLEDRFGDEKIVKEFGWISRAEFKRLKQTANSHRHRRGGKHRPHRVPLDLPQALKLLAKMIENAFSDSARSPRAGLPYTQTLVSRLVSKCPNSGRIQARAAAYLKVTAQKGRPVMRARPCRVNCHGAA